MTRKIEFQFDAGQLEELIQKMLKIYTPKQLYLGFGPKVTDIQPYEL